jgi:DNA-binding response OmpR family regulator
VKVLLIEDDAMVGRFLTRALRDEGFEPILCKDGATGIAAVADHAPDAIVLDWMLPDMTGLDVCQAVRENRIDLPILMLTARGETKDKVHGLEAGADDYLTKPFEFEELLARLRAVTRRTRSSAAKVSYGPLAMDRVNHRAWLHGELLSLTTREFRLLSAICTREGTPVTRTTLLEEVWDSNEATASNLVDVHMSRLREKLGQCAWLLATVRGQGYRLQVEEIASE